MANKDYLISGGGAFAHTALLAESVDYLTPTLKFTDISHPDDDLPEPGWSILMGEEIMLVTAISGDNYTVQRGCADTIPHQHQASARAWFLDDAVQSNQREYAGGDKVGVKVLPFLPLGKRLPIEKAEPHPLTFNYRFWRSYPPGQMRANSARWWNPVNLAENNPVVRLTWVHRNRLTLVDQLVGHDEANLPPEPGQTCVMRVFNHIGNLVRTEVGIQGMEFTYTWGQAVNDFGQGTSEGDNILIGRIEFTSYRVGFDGWQAYQIPLYLNTRAPFMNVGQFSEQIGQENDEQPQQARIYAADLGEQIAQENPEPTLRTMMAAQVSEEVGQLTAFYTPLTRFVIEEPYTRLLRAGRNPLTHDIMTMTARPSDRMTDNHHVYTQSHETQPWVPVDFPPFTPWVMIDDNLPQLTSIVEIKNTSLDDGVALDQVRVGQMAYLNGEIVRLVELGLTHIKLARGCADTVPAYHSRLSRIWFFEAAQGRNRPDFGYQGVEKIPTRIVPTVYGPALDPMVAPLDSVDLARRTLRPFPPGQMLVNGKPWYEGATARPGEQIVLTWVQRNRLTQGVNVVDHLMADTPHEPLTTYRISVSLKLVSQGGGSTKITLFSELVDGRTFTFTYDMAKIVGSRAASVMQVCGWVTVPLYVDAMRDDLENWQGYSIPLTLPAPPCPPGQYPGGGQGPNPSTPGGGNNGGGSGGGGNNGGNGNNGPDNPNPNNPDPVDPKPPTWPPIPPDPIDPQQPGEPNPTDTTPDPDDNGEHWDFTWDIHWDAYRRYGDNNQGNG